MKILAISDVHGEDNENLYKYLNNNDIDIVIITGDITNFGPLEFVDEFIGKILDCDCEVMAVPGNCDPAGICNAIRESDAICLHNNILSFDNVVLFGYGGSNPTPFDTPGEIQDNKIYGDVYELLANYDFVANDEVPKVKILVTPFSDIKRFTFKSTLKFSPSNFLLYSILSMSSVKPQFFFSEMSSTKKVNFSVIGGCGIKKYFFIFCQIFYLRQFC